MKTKYKLIAVVAAVVLVGLGGYVLGVCLRPAWLAQWLAVAGRSADEHDDHGREHDDQRREGHDEHDHEDGDEHDARAESAHVAISPEASANLGIVLGPVVRATHDYSMRVPAEIVEKPGHSDHALTAPVNGIVSRVHALPGQAVRPGDPLFELQVIDEQLAESQLDLVNALLRLEVIDAELSRLDPLATTGAVAPKRKLELEYERSTLRAKRDLRIQELQIHGLTDAQIDDIVGRRRLLSEFTVLLPEALVADHADDAGGGTRAALPRPVTTGEAGDGWDFTIEQLAVFPGKSVRRGDDLCHIAYHTALHIRGQAFEGEVDAIANAERNGWTLTAEFGSGDDVTSHGGIRVRYVDNHVDPETQTYAFFAPLRNEVVLDTLDEHGKRYRTWRYKPGQRCRLVVPLQRLPNQIKLPAEAIAREGADAFVFRWLSDTAPPPSLTADSPETAVEGEVEFEPVPVRILHEDPRSVLISAGGRLREGDLVVMRNAFQLHLTLKRQSRGDSSGGHHHDHPH